MTITKEDLEEEVLQGIYEVRVAPERKQGCTKFINFGKQLVKLDRLQAIDINQSGNAFVQILKIKL